MPLPTVAMILYPQFNPIHFAMTYAVFSAEVDGAPLFDLKIVAPNKAAQKAERALHAQADGGLALLAAALKLTLVRSWKLMALLIKTLRFNTCPSPKQLTP